MSEAASARSDSMPSAYDPHAVEGRWFDFWVERGYFRAPVREGQKPFVIMIPPPNVTGSLHMGHALNNTIQDVLVRRQRMIGVPTLWLPGTDHAGIATQNKVEQQLAEEGLSRHDVGREAFLERVWAWKEKYGSTIIGQLKKMGCSCDYSRERFTMDEGYSRAIRRVFVELYRDGLIYRGLRLINWCPRCHTALSDIEVDHEERHSTLYYIRYPLAGDGGRFIEVATVRPETMLGDTGVAVNPSDERYADLVGRTAVLPLVGRELPIVADDFVDPAFGTGALKVTPAHDPNDYEMGERHGLETVNILTDDAHINDNGGDFAGMERFEAREAVVAALDDEGFLVKTEDYEHSVGTCYRCHTLIEPYLSEQWFVDMKPLAVPAIDAVRDGRVRFVPERWGRLYFEWMENIRDWCVSRQIWWGHQIPAWYCVCGETVVAEETPERCPACGSGELEQDEDVLDTWFSSALWPFATLGWPDETEDLGYFYPTTVLSTARDILYLWVARMIMMGLRFAGDIPYEVVNIHQTVLNFEGRRMSKSLGTGVDPLDLMEHYGADGMRYGLMLQATQAQDMRFTEEKLAASRHFANKIWNAARLVLSHVDPAEPVPVVDGAQVVPGFTGAASADGLADRWVLSRLAACVTDVDGAIGAFEFGEATRRLYDFFWGDYCDWYLEWVKPALRGERGDGARAAAMGNLLFVLDVALRLLHPFMPFITEDLWQRLPRFTELDDGTAAEDSIMAAPWPVPADFAARRDVEAEAEFDRIQAVVTAVRTIRSQFSIPPSAAVGLMVRGGRATLSVVDEHDEDVRALAGISAIERAPEGERPGGCAYAVVGDVEIFVPLEGLVDLDTERERVGRALAKARKELDAVRRKLTNEGFLSKAPKEVVAKERAKAAELSDTCAKLSEALDRIAGG